ncbi:MAG: universal stress protein [Amphritea sp.]
MYKKIMVPVDLLHIERLEKALVTASDLSKLYGIPVCYVGVAAALPSLIAHNPDEFTLKMELFGKTQADKYDLKNVTTAAYISHDPAVDLDNTLMKAAEDIGADLVVMASHVPGLVEHIFASNAGYLASYAKVSVFVVR